MVGQLHNHDYMVIVRNMELFWQLTSTVISNVPKLRCTTQEELTTLRSVNITSTNGKRNAIDYKLRSHKFHTALGQITQQQILTHSLW